MKITKFGHACLLVEEKQARIIIDPGSFSSLQNDAQNIDAVLISHEHQDHLDIASLKSIIQNNPLAIIYSNKSVAGKLLVENISCQVLEHNQTILVKDVSVQACGVEHAEILPTIPLIQNIGFFIGERLFFPGDAFTVPSKPVEILALPVCAPWSKLSEVIAYIKNVKPKIAFPIHDAILSIKRLYYHWPEQTMLEMGGEWKVIEDGESKDF
jgi:L-ascorbate metabolism protein UlaG (beta-lactamase superfamily)